MLRKIVVQGLVATAMVAGAAALYAASAADNPAAQPQPPAQETPSVPPVKADNGYLPMPAASDLRKHRHDDDDDEHEERHERHDRRESRWWRS